MAEGQGSVIWAFREKLGTVRLKSVGVRDEGTKTRKWVSHYVHTWIKTVPSYNFSVADLGLTLTDADGSWLLASSVIY